MKSRPSGHSKHAGDILPVTEALMVIERAGEGIFGVSWPKQ